MPAVVSDFTVVQGDVSKRIGDGAIIWEKRFRTDGAINTRPTILMFMVKGLTAAESSVEVKINGERVGVIFPYTGSDGDHWFTQIVNIGPRVLNDGDNELQIVAESFPDAGRGDLFDDFYIRDAVCWFKQES